MATAPVLLRLSFIQGRVAFLNGWSGGLSLTLTIIGYVGGIVLAIFGIIFGVRYARNKITIAMGAIFLVALIYALNAIDPVSVAFLLQKDKYENMVASDATTGPKFIVLNSKFSAASAAGFGDEAIIFDSTDEIGVPPAERTQDWVKSHGSRVTPFNVRCEVVVQHLSGHYFYVSQNC